MRWMTFLVLALISSSVYGDELPTMGSVSFEGAIIEPEQLSGAAFCGKHLILCPDEGVTLNVLKRLTPTRFAHHREVQLKDEADEELDMEGLASDGKHLYVAGSHSLARKQVEEDRTYEKNLERLRDIKGPGVRDRVYRVTLDDDGKLAEKDHLSLTKLLRKDELLGPFTAIPSKENGIDIEGIAVKDKQLYLGCRGPILRENYVPVIVLDFEEPEDYELRFVTLGGRGIRDIAATKNGFLMLTGPVGDGDQSYELYSWNGKDCLPGSGSPGGTIKLLGQIPKLENAKAEGIAVVEESNEQVTLLVVYDGVAAGMLVRAKP